MTVGDYPRLINEEDGARFFGRANEGVLFYLQVYFAEGIITH